MDDYLKSLVKVEEVETSDDVEEPVSVAADEVETSLESELADSAAEQAVYELINDDTESIEAPAEDELIAEIKDNADVPDSESIDQICVKSQDDAITEINSSLDLIVGKEYDINAVRVYKTPDEHQVSSTISGRIIFLGKIEPFAIIKYMKHGFGLVQGYIKDIESVLK